MTKKLKVEIFTDIQELCDFVNLNGITKENIQAIKTNCVDSVVIDMLFYWKYEE